MELAAGVGDEINTLIGTVAGVTVKVVVFLVLLGLGWIVAGWLRTWVSRLLVRAGFDRAAERGGLHGLLGDRSASSLTARLVSFAFMLFVLELAFSIFGPNPVNALLSQVIAWLPQLFVAAVIVVVAAAAGSWLRDLIRGALDGVGYGSALATAAQAFVVGLGLIAAVNQIGVGRSVTLPILITVLATIGGILVVGVGGGLVRPMQHRWEHMLNRAETETTLAAERVRANRSQARPDRTGPDEAQTAGTRTDWRGTDWGASDWAATEDDEPTGPVPFREPDDEATRPIRPTGQDPPTDQIPPAG